MQILQHKIIRMIKIAAFYLQHDPSPFKLLFSGHLSIIIHQVQTNQQQQQPKTTTTTAWLRHFIFAQFFYIQCVFATSRRTRHDDNLPQTNEYIIQEKKPRFNNLFILDLTVRQLCSVVSFNGVPLRITSSMDHHSTDCCLTSRRIRK